MAATPESADEIGQTIAGRYTIEAVLGRGGMGAVYRVRDARNGECVALKRARARDARKAQKRKALLEREYHTLSQLAHPRIIEVYDYGIDEVGPYYTMELLDGKDLDHGGRIAWKLACAVLCDVASSLAILHSRGLLHRDVSARNVRITGDGRAKLIDFGAMASMGVSKDVVGTPPFVSPEAMQMQALDARSDLFSLGALGYLLLTSRHAYPARRLAELRDVWRSRPHPPSRFTPDMPPALSALIMELLSLDRGARPQSATEVMERLCAIAGMPSAEHVEVSRAYLTTPTLVGREQAMVAVRRRMLSLARGDGGVLLVEGESGSGRSRLLDACALEGKLLGASVVRADISDAEQGDFGVARALGSQLVALLPEQALESTRLSRDVLGHVLEGLPAEGNPSTRLPERSLLIRELRDFILSLAHDARIVLVVDDADRIDEPSAALLAALAHKTERHGLIVALAVDRERSSRNSPALRLMRLVSEPIALEPLQPEQSEALMRSVFGDVPNLPLIAGRIHALSQGNPRVTMELAQHLVHCGLARYRSGAWGLPASLDAADLPSSLAMSLSARLDELGADARELADMLCLADGDGVTLHQYAQLTAHGDAKRVFSALDALVTTRVLCADVERYRFSQRGFLPVLEESMSSERRTALHAKLADVLAGVGGDLLRRVHHLFEADRDREAITLLASIDLMARLPPLALLERAVQRAERLAVPARTLHRLRSALLIKAPLVPALDVFRRHVPAVLAQLERDSGLARYRELPDSMPAQERLAQALTDTQQRYLALPEDERVYAVVEAIRELGRVSAAFCSVGIMAFDVELLEALPSLEPLLPLSPALHVVSTILEASRHWVPGRSRRARALYEQVLARIAEPDRAGLDESQHARTRMGLQYSLGLLEASMGIAVEQRAQVLEGDREMRVNAWRLRQIFCLSQGDIAEARACMRRAELLQLQENLGERYLGTTAALELSAYARLGDLVMVKSTLDSVITLAERHVGWHPVRMYCEASCRLLAGDPAGALPLIEAGLKLARPGRHLYFGQLATLHVEALIALGRGEEALARSREYIAGFEREGLVMLDHALYVACARALIVTGDHVTAASMLDAQIALAESDEKTGLPLGALLEARARAAICAGDAAAFERFSARCALEYGRARNPAVHARFTRLLGEARKHELAPRDPLAIDDVLVTVDGDDLPYETVHSRMQECLDPADRARTALTLLLQSTESSAGFLFGVRAGGVVLLAAVPENSPEDEMQRWVEQCAREELEADLLATGSQTGTADDEGESEGQLDVERTGAFRRYTDQEGRCFESMLLVPQAGRRLAGVLALHVSAGVRTIPPRALRSEIAEQLLDHGDVDGVGPTSEHD